MGEWKLRGEEKGTRKGEGRKWRKRWDLYNAFSFYTFRLRACKLTTKPYLLFNMLA